MGSSRASEASDPDIAPATPPLDRSSFEPVSPWWGQGPGHPTPELGRGGNIMTLDIQQPEFWKLDQVDAELRRVYDICAGCRRCLPLCPSFKVLFDRLDVEAVDGDVEKLPAADVKHVVDLCYQCKLCYNHCPYTPPHRWAVDFPRLMLRARSAEARRKGVTLQDRFLGNTELVGRLGSLTAPLSNWMTALPVQRKLMEATVGIHRERKLPAFHRETFSRWFDQRRAAPFTPRGRVGLL